MRTTEIGFGECLYTFVFKNSIVNVNWQYDKIIDNIKNGSITQKGLIEKSRLAKPTVIKYLEVLYKWHIIKFSEVYNGRGPKSKVISLNPHAKFSEVKIDPRPWKILPK